MCDAKVTYIEYHLVSIPREYGTTTVGWGDATTNRKSA
jgi:hypothetical protein